MRLAGLKLVRIFLGRHRVAVRSVLLFAALVVVWIIAFPRIMDAHALDWLMRLVAGFTAFLLFLLGNPVTVSGTLVSSPAFSMEVGSECTGIVPAALLVFAVVASPSPVLAKLICLGLGIPLVFLLNLVRTVSLYYAGIHLPQYFDILHFVVWQSLTILAVITIWLLWLGKAAHVRPA